MINWLNVPNETNRNAFIQVAENNRMSAYVAEKDWWVVQALSVMFDTSLKDHLVFKGSAFAGCSSPANSFQSSP